MYKIEVGFADICEAYTRIKPYIVKTPLIKSDKLSEFAGSDVWFKLENMQPIGAYQAARRYEQYARDEQGRFSTRRRCGVGRQPFSGGCLCSAGCRVRARWCAYLNQRR